jgi:hypothetical protein
MNELVYPISLNYVPNWNEWEIVRELTANAKDTGEKFSVHVEDKKLIVQDDGKGLAIKHLLLGESHKENENAIGQFGEGLKLALLVATRMEKTVEIYSGNFYIVNDTAEIDGVKVLKLMWDTTKESYNGTKIVVNNWENEDFQDRFIFDLPEDELILTNTSGSILWEKKLYVKGVFVTNLDNYEFGYNVDTIQMNRDRNAVSEWDIQCGIGKIWKEVDDPEGWKTFFLASKAGKLENVIYLPNYGLSSNVKNALIKGFKMAFGEKSVLKTSDDASREAEHRGAKSIDAYMFGSYVRDIIKNYVQTDVDYVTEKRGEKAFNVPYSNLNEIQRKNLSFLKRMGKKVDFYGKILVAELPNALGSADHFNNCIKIRPEVLLDEFESQIVMIHELAHIVYKTDDTTDAHVEACCKIGARLMK